MNVYTIYTYIFPSNLKIVGKKYLKVFNNSIVCYKIQSHS